VHCGREPSAAAAEAQMTAVGVVGSVRTMSEKRSGCSGQRSYRSNNGRALSMAR